MNSIQLPSISNLPYHNLSVLSLAPLQLKSSPAIYNCSKCPKQFTRKSSLSRHYRKHEGSKPHWCKACNKCFNRKDTLSKHKESRRCISRSQASIYKTTSSDYSSQSSRLSSPTLPSDTESKMSISWLLADSSDFYISSVNEISLTTPSFNTYFY